MVSTLHPRKVSIVKQKAKGNIVPALVKPHTHTHIYFPFCLSILQKWRIPVFPRQLCLGRKLAQVFLIFLKYRNSLPDLNHWTWPSCDPGLHLTFFSSRLTAEPWQRCLLPTRSSWVWKMQSSSPNQCMKSNSLRTKQFWGTAPFFVNHKGLCGSC